MKVKKFSLISALISFVAAFIVGVIINSVTAKTESTVGLIIGTALFFLLMFISGYIGLRASIVLLRKNVLNGNGIWLAVVALASVLIILVASLGQFLFMFSVNVNINKNSSTNIVLLLDTSGSMYGYETDRITAASAFIDGLNDDCNLKVCSFSSQIIDNSGFKKMDSNGKAEMKKFVEEIDSTGDTDYGYVLSQTLSDLESEGVDSNDVGVIMVTDALDASISGNGLSLTQEVIDEYVENDIKFFSIRLGYEDAYSSPKPMIVELAEQSKGFDTVFSDNNFNAKALLETFENAFETTKNVNTQFKNASLITAQKITVYQFFIRTITLFLCAAIFGIGYYASFDLKQFLTNGISGIVASVLISLIGKTPFISALIICALIATAFVSFDTSGGETLDV